MNGHEMDLVMQKLGEFERKVTEAFRSSAERINQMGVGVENRIVTETADLSGQITDQTTSLIKALVRGAAEEGVNFDERISDVEARILELDRRLVALEAYIPGAEDHATIIRTLEQKVRALEEAMAELRTRTRFLDKEGKP